MTKLTEFLSPKNVRQGVLISSKKRALELVGKIVAESINQTEQQSEALCPIECFGNLFKREKLGTTGLNQGIALPHAKLPACGDIELTKPIAVFLQLEESIDYEAQDNKEVDLIYAMMFPENSCEQYKGCLPAIAQKLTDKSLLKQLRAAESAEDIWQILMYADNQNIENQE
ncbi:TPA: PTS sugar transporter subunit IIA [Mannheimia haemolytica]